MRAYPWATAALVRPHLPQAAAEEPEEGPDLWPVIPPPPGPVSLGRFAPARPQVAAAPAPEHDLAEKPTEPLLVPQLTAEEAADSRRQTTESLDRAERNLETLRGRPLTPAQMDLASKVRSFAAEARSAAGQNDWLRARALARKAQVLSEELAGSL